MKSSVWMTTFLSLVLCSFQALAGQVTLDVRINETPVCSVTAYMANRALMRKKSSHPVDDFMVSVTPSTRLVDIEVSYLGALKLKNRISLQKWNQQRIGTPTTFQYELDDNHRLIVTVTDTRTEPERLGDLDDNME